MRYLSAAFREKQTIGSECDSCARNVIGFEVQFGDDNVLSSGRQRCKLVQYRLKVLV